MRDRPATIVNVSGRVVTSTDARREHGSVLRAEGLVEAIRSVSPVPLALPGGVAVLACGDTSLALVVGTLPRDHTGMRQQGHALDMSNLLTIRYAIPPLLGGFGSQVLPLCEISMRNLALPGAYAIA